MDGTIAPTVVDTPGMYVSRRRDSQVRLFGLVRMRQVKERPLKECQGGAFFVVFEVKQTKVCVARWCHAILPQRLSLLAIRFLDCFYVCPLVRSRALVQTPGPTLDGTIAPTVVKTPGMR